MQANYKEYNTLCILLLERIIEISKLYKSDKEMKKRSLILTDMQERFNQLLKADREIPIKLARLYKDDFLQYVSPLDLSEIANKIHNELDKPTNKYDLTKKELLDLLGNISELNILYDVFTDEQKKEIDDMLKKMIKLL